MEMSHHFWTASLYGAFLCLGVAGCRSAGRTGSASPAGTETCQGQTQQDSVTAVLEAQRVAWNRGDLEGYMAGYERSEQLLFTSGANIRRGWETTFAKYRQRYGESPETMGQLSFEILDVRMLNCDAAVVLGEWELTQSQQPGAGVFSVVLMLRFKTIMKEDENRIGLLDLSFFSSI